MKAPANIATAIKRLRKLYPDAKCSLEYREPFQLLISTILSAQCTDERVNKVTPALFKKYPSPETMAKAGLSDLETLVKSTGFYKNKAKSLKGASEKIVSVFGGKLPQTMDDMIRLPGVGRKTANVVLGNAFDKPAGVVVDTHVRRLSFRMGLTKQTDPEKVEIDLNRLVPKKDWVEFPHWMIQHGRAVCEARKPRCGACGLASLCPKRGVKQSL